VIGAAYTLLQLPFALYYALTEKRLIKVDILPELDLYGDKVRFYTQNQGSPTNAFTSLKQS